MARARPAAAPSLIILGRIATLRTTTGFGWVEALAISGGRVQAAGSRHDILALTGSHGDVWRLPASLVVMPSITDAHLHFSAAAAAAGQPDLTGLSHEAARETIVAAHRERLAQGDADGWLLGHGWSFDALGARPDAASLDGLAPGRPIALWAHDHHSRWIDAEALRRSGLADRADPPAGHIERDADGTATGLLIEAAAGLVDAAIPARDLGQTEAALIAYAATLAGLGVTSVHDPGDLAPDPELRAGPVHYRHLAEHGRLPLRVTASVREEQLDRAIEMGFRTGRPAEAGEVGRYRDGWLKMFSDGALGSRTAALLAPYEQDDPAGAPPGGPRGMLLHSAEQLSRLAGRAASAGIASQLHAIGDAAVRTALDVLAKLPQVGAAQHRVEHAQLVDPADRLRFGQLGIAASVQPCHLLSDAQIARSAWGQRSASAFPLATIARGGASLPFGTDAPVEPPDPWPGIAAAVTRRGAGWPPGAAFHPEQALSLERAVRAACLDGPRSLGVLDEGHLESGARADLLVLPAETFDEPLDPARVSATRPLATLLDGRVVASTADFDP